MSKALSLKDFEKEKQNALILDLRIPDIFERGFIPKSLNIGTNGDYVTWIQELVEKDRKLLLVCPENKEKELFETLEKLGYSNICGWLKGGFETWKNADKRIDMVISITPEEMWMDLGFLNENEIVIDLRTEEERKEGFLDKSESVPLEKIAEAIQNLDAKNTYYLYCSGGYRSMIGASFLKLTGIPLVKNVYGGYIRIKAEKKG